MQRGNLTLGSNEFSEMSLDSRNMTDVPGFLIRNEMSRCPSAYHRLEMGLSWLMPPDRSVPL